jgi:hypothetical protein
MSKTICQWYKELPEDIRKKAIKNTLDQVPDLLDSKEKQLSSALFSGFQWALSPEGFKFWDEVYGEAAKKG